jgi:Mg/Co/Ni transporter MgtE
LGHKDVTEVLHSHDKTQINEVLLSMDVQRNCFLHMETTPDEDAGKIVEIMTKDLKYYV